MANENEFVITREFNASRNLMWQLWTQAKHLKKWFGPATAGLEIFSVKVSLQPGGVFHYGLKSPDGFEMWGKFVYKEIDEPNKLVFVASFSDASEGITVHPMSATWPKEVLSTIIFTESEGKTTLHMTGVPINASDEEVKTFVEGMASMKQGWGGTFGLLETYLTTF